MRPDATTREPGGAGADDEGGRGRRLLFLAREAVTAAVGGGAVVRGAARSLPVPASSALSASPVPGDDEPWLRAPGATFVTLTQRRGRLRGCMGSIFARRPLGEDVRANARAAALSDPRFPPLAAAELAATRIEVSLLSALSLLAAATEEQALAALRPGLDGVVLEHGGDAQATFLPQVWESLPSPRDFLAQLKRKAGLPPDFWSPDLQLRRYSVVRWREPD